jgi:hypothetical protein
MPIKTEIIGELTTYIDRDLPQGLIWYIEQFSFIEDRKLKEYLANEFYTARYIYKLMEALNVKARDLNAHVKFQIIQYASIFESVICYLLWNKYKDHEAVQKIQYHLEYHPVQALSKKSRIFFDDEEVYICRLKKDVKTPEYSIKFDDKVNAAVEIGFLKSDLAEDIKQIYKLRNNVHTSKAAKAQFTFELEQSKKAYLRMEPFIIGIKEFIE